MLFGSTTVQADAKPRIPNGGWRYDFSYTVSPWDLSVTPDGVLVAQVCIAEARPGVNGVHESPQHRATKSPAVRIHEDSGRDEVDDRIEVVAFGEKRKGYCVRYDPTQGAPQFLDAWTRPKWEHGEYCPEIDAAGYRAFLAQLAAAMDPTPSQIARAERQAGVKVAAKPKK